jgi:TPR repeat protein
MEDEQAEIEARLQKMRIGANKKAMRLALFVLIAYGCLRVSHWLFDLPSSQSTITAISISLAVLWVLVAADLCVDILLAEFRMHLENLNKKITSLQEQVTDLSDAVNSSRPISKEEETENDEALIARYRAAAEHGEAWGQYNLAVTYSNGEKLPKDKALAAFWYRRAAEHGDIPSMQFLGDLLAGGHGIEPNYLEAVRLYKLVADSGHTYSAMAEYSLGEMYAEGKGIPRDLDEAIKYWKRASGHGWDLAATKLERLYEREGISPDFQAAS